MQELKSRERLRLLIEFTEIKIPWNRKSNFPRHTDHPSIAKISVKK